MPAGWVHEMRPASLTPHAPILIVDSDRASRAHMSSVLERVGYRTVEASTGEEALELARQERPRMVVLEVCLGDLSGYEICRELRDEFGDQLLVVFVSAARAESHDRVAGFLVGGDDYLVKPFALDEFVARVRRLLERAEGRTVFASALTTRELEVLSLVAEGLGRDAIAKSLFISPRTVGTHCERIFKKLDVHTRAEAVSFAYRHGLLPLSGERASTEGGASLAPTKRR
jgi:DNA-binding NarL/FixJ family response regulator